MCSINAVYKHESSTIFSLLRQFQLQMASEALFSPNGRAPAGKASGSPSLPSLSDLASLLSSQHADVALSAVTLPFDAAAAAVESSHASSLDVITQLVTGASEAGLVSTADLLSQLANQDISSSIISSIEQSLLLSPQSGGADATIFPSAVVTEACVALIQDISSDGSTLSAAEIRASLDRAMLAVELESKRRSYLSAALERAHQSLTACDTELELLRGTIADQDLPASNASPELKHAFSALETAGACASKVRSLLGLLRPALFSADDLVQDIIDSSGADVLSESTAEGGLGFSSHGSATGEALQRLRQAADDACIGPVELVKGAVEQARQLVQQQAQLQTADVQKQRQQAQQQHDAVGDDSAAVRRACAAALQDVASAGESLRIVLQSEEVQRLSPSSNGSTMAAVAAVESAVVTACDLLAAASAQCRKLDDPLYLQAMQAAAGVRPAADNAVAALSQLVTAPSSASDVIGAPSSAPDAIGAPAHPTDETPALEVAPATVSIDNEPAAIENDGGPTPADGQAAHPQTRETSGDGQAESSIAGEQTIASIQAPSALGGVISPVVPYNAVDNTGSVTASASSDTAYGPQTPSADVDLPPWATTDDIYSPSSSSSSQRLSLLGRAQDALTEVMRAREQAGLHGNAPLGADINGAISAVDTALAAVVAARPSNNESETSRLVAAACVMAHRCETMLARLQQLRLQGKSLLRRLRRLSELYVAAQSKHAQITEAIRSAASLTSVPTSSSTFERSAELHFINAVESAIIEGAELPLLDGVVSSSPAPSSATALPPVLQQLRSNADDSLQLLQQNVASLQRLIECFSEAHGIGLDGVPFISDALRRPGAASGKPTADIEEAASAIQSEAAEQMRSIGDALATVNLLQEKALARSAALAAARRRRLIVSAAAQLLNVAAGDEVDAASIIQAEELIERYQSGSGDGIDERQLVTGLREALGPSRLTQLKARHSVGDKPASPIGADNPSASPDSAAVPHLASDDGGDTVSRMVHAAVPPIATAETHASLPVPSPPPSNEDVADRGVSSAAMHESLMNPPANNLSGEATSSADHGQPVGQADISGVDVAASTEPAVVSSSAGTEPPQAATAAESLPDSSVAGAPIDLETAYTQQQTIAKEQQSEDSSTSGSAVGGVVAYSALEALAALAIDLSEVNGGGDSDIEGAHLIEAQAVPNPPTSSTAASNEPAIIANHHMAAASGDAAATSSAEDASVSVAEPALARVTSAPSTPTRPSLSSPTGASAATAPQPSSPFLNASVTRVSLASVFQQGTAVAADKLTSPHSAGDVKESVPTFRVNRSDSDAESLAIPPSPPPAASSSSSDAAAAGGADATAAVIASGPPISLRPKGATTAASSSSSSVFDRLASTVPAHKRRPPADDVAKSVRGSSPLKGSAGTSDVLSAAAAKPVSSSKADRQQRRLPAGALPSYMLSDPQRPFGGYLARH